MTAQARARRAAVRPAALPAPAGKAAPAPVPAAAAVRHILHSPRPQPKLTVGAPDDAFEHEADQVADQVMRMPESGVAAASAPPRVQRRCADCEEELRAKEEPGETPEVPHGFAQRFAALHGGGRPLPAAERAFFEPRFGRDFGGVRLHNGPAASDLARSVHARAFTLGDSIVLGDGQYAPGTSGGRQLLAHELTHVVQQGGASVRDSDASSMDSAVIRRQSVPAPRPAEPGPEDDPIDPYDYPELEWWLLEGDFPGMPTVEDARAALNRWKPHLTLPLAEATPTAYPPRRRGGHTYWAFRHPTAGVLARVYMAESGATRVGGGWQPTYGVYALMPASEGLALHALSTPAATGPGGRQTATGSAPPASADPLLDLYFQHFPPEPGGTPTSRIDQPMRVRLALTLADRTFWGEVYETAMEAITNPLFIAQTILLIGIYVGLWLVPDPVVTKIVAGLLTAALLAMFTWQDIIGFARAWFQLGEDCAAATSEGELRAAGNAFLQMLGQVGFDVLVMILFWAAGRAVRPRLAAARARASRAATLRAETAVQEATQAPGSGAQQRPPITPAEQTVLTEAGDAAGQGASPAQVLDQVATRLPEAAREGLRVERARAGDARTLNTLQNRARGGRDVFRWLEEQGMTQEQTAAAQQALVDAQAALVRARLVELQSLQDPALRRTLRMEIRRNLTDFARALRRGSLRLREAIREGSLDEVVGELGEALARAQLRRGLPPGRNLEVITGLELARRIPGFRTISEWVAAEQAAGRDPGARLGRMRQGPDGVYESAGQIDNLVGERLGDGRVRVLEIEETKTGGESGASAAQQVGRARGMLADIQAGTTDVRIMERPSRNAVGSDVTSHFDLSQGDAIDATTRGPEGRTGFDRSLGVSRTQLRAVARQILVEGLPPGEPGAARLIQTSGTTRRDRPASEPAPAPAH